ncbi:hypothetical protein H696_01854 [Fonticula alba]|uniref:AB hydrolase-1 domain-containing protein n=1 Tax=Fonticula alba TaxID=691883 RepID=A0A058ZAB6_FONAL|nr:hypothetical protein H696_01854 [Fonticula alba]KCV70908.1 hypothetical protein H696_01854 [Fonticula alba]|eukprot:XP_009494031.1 hypothetical protein H696_01854 [Fonticula alba]
MQSFSKDIAELADHLEVDKFHIVGWSSGGCYALAAGSFLGPRVIGIGSISTDPQWVDVPPSDPHNEKQYTALLRLFWLLTRPLWPVRNLALPVAGFLMSRLLLANLALSAAGNPRMQRIQHRLLESLRQGHRGATRDMVVERSPWGFCLKTHPSRVDLWHAIDDKAVPVMSVAYLADRLPDQQMILRRTGGHNMVVREWDAILELLINRKALPGPGEEAEAPAPAPPTPK